MIDSNNIEDEKKELGIFVIIKYLHYPWSSIILFKTGLGFVVNVYHNLWGNNLIKEREV